MPRTTRVTAIVTDRDGFARAEFCDGEENAEITVDGSTMRHRANSIELLYHALHELFGARNPA